MTPARSSISNRRVRDQTWSKRNPKAISQRARQPSIFNFSYAKFSAPHPVRRGESVFRRTSGKRAGWADRFDRESATPPYRQDRQVILDGCKKKESPAEQSRPLRAASRRCGRELDSTAFRAGQESTCDAPSKKHRPRATKRCRWNKNRFGRELPSSMERSPSHQSGPNRTRTGHSNRFQDVARRPLEL